MGIPSSRFDATDPFAQAKLQMKQAETVLRQLPPVQREQLLAELQPPIPVRQSSPAIETAVTMVTVKVDEWDGGPAARPTAPMMMRRPRRIVGTIPWQWRLIVAGIRLARIVRKSAKQQMKQFNKLQRQMIRRVLPRHKAMRGARVR
ncbi:hypothetical protein [Extensimonas vulgaris]|jgi:hypothetical protein|uniref:Uncharacterized protein n=1 Tax=Extensimonas vulgaris TaxID=1031594 RepID=A0A369AK43_9BURK|nr:hypothetical protein [Extensimonas vulgaris]RCX08656.1 hypothetical protein DFR45_108157 [Extensimonas vulgaris]TWI36271.1 hypothetical protein IP95_02475 [Extensimonas vulgaris]TXD13952.1 hypothetical protein FUT63_10220 [Extensimonas vulgaris]